MDTTNQQGAFGSLDDTTSTELTHETLAALVATDPVAAVKVIVCHGEDGVDSLRTSEIVEYAENFHSKYRPSEPFLGHYLLIVDETGGDEGGGEYVERIIGIHTGDKAGTSFVQITGCYYSNDGTYWDDDQIKRVYPREVTVIQYFDTP